MLHQYSTFVNRSAILAVALLAVLFSGRMANAQGTSGTLPDPISTAELLRYADRLGLSEEQRRAAERLHDDYREQFRHLREGEIADFLRQMRGMQGRMPGRKSLEDFLRKWDDLYGKIAQLDDRMIMSLQEILTEQQMVMLPRIRMARERARYGGSMTMMMTQSRPADLSEIVERLDLRPAEREAIDGALLQYEHALTRAMKELYETGNRMFLDMYTAFEEAGYDEESMQDPEQAAEAMQVMQEVMAEIYGRIMRKATELRDTNLRTLKSVTPLLPAQSARTLRNACYSQMYRGIDYALGIPVQAKIATALQLEEISDSLRESLAALEAETTRRLDRILNEAVELAETGLREFNPMTMNDPENTDMQDRLTRMSELTRDALELDQTTHKRLTELLATELDEAARQLVETAQPEETPAIGGAAGRLARAQAEARAAAERHQEDGARRSPYDQYLPNAISRADLTMYRRVLGLGEEHRETLEKLHESYMERFDALKETHLEPMVAARSSMWRHDEETGSTNITREGVERIAQLRQEALAAIIAADESFFAEVQAALVGESEDLPTFERVRMMRKRDMYRVNSAHTMFSMPGINQDQRGRVDLSRLVRRLNLPQTHLDHIDATLTRYERDITDIVKEQYEAAIDLNAADQQWQIILAEQTADGNFRNFDYQEYQRLRAEPQRRLNDANMRIADFNDETLNELVTLLDHQSARRLTQSFNREAYPSIFDDPTAMEEHLTSAMRLEDLTEQQRSQLADVLAEYRASYAEMTEGMIELARERPTTKSFDEFEQEDWQRIMALQEKVQRIRFERSELNTRAIGQVRAILNQPQLASIGPLPEPIEESTSPWGF